MLFAVVILQAWRLTGVILHEWLAVALIGGVLAHLALHWPWVQSRSRRVLSPRSGRTRVNYILNLTLFLAMAAAMISGLMISKAALPNHLAAAEYLKWHSIHELSSRAALVAAGLHLSLNWDLMLAAIRNFATRRILQSASARVSLQVVMSAIAIITVALTIEAAGLRGLERILPREDVTIVRPDGRRVEHADPPPDVARLRRGEAGPSSRGLPALVANAVLLIVSVVGGRSVLRLRLE